MEEQELHGSSVCPICGVDRPHWHSDEQTAAYREDQVHGGDGWTSVALRQPKEWGFYLCLDVRIDPDQYGKPKDFWQGHERWSQLSWFLWVRDGGKMGRTERDIPEVLFYDNIQGNWQLRNLLGNAAVSGAESRHPVIANPRYWRPLPVARKSTGSANG